LASEVYGALALMQPIERGVEFVLVDLAEAEFDAEAGGGGRRIERLGGRQFGAGAMIRLTFIARTGSRGRLGSRLLLGPSNRSRPMARVGPSTAPTWPCGS
jgi:hypothetical protein